MSCNRTVAAATHGPRIIGCAAAALLAVARWCPAQCQTAWHGFHGGGLDGQASRLLAFDVDGSGPAPAALFVGGTFYKSGGVLGPHLTRWDGADWSSVGGGTENTVYNLAIFDDDGPGPHAAALYACGSFTVAGGVPANRIARWDGNAWSGLGTGLNEAGLVMAVFDEDGAGPAPAALYVGGAFTAAGGAPAARIARWDGSTWSALGSGVGGTDAGVGGLAVFDDDGPGPVAPALYASGSFTTAGGVPAHWIARWNGSAWSAVGSGLDAPFTSSGAGALAVFDEDGPGPALPALFAGGSFDTAGGITAHNIARWNGAAWSAVGGGMAGGNATVTSLIVYDDDGSGSHAPALYAGGGFTIAGSASAIGVARWNGVAWSGLGAGVGGGYGNVNALGSFDEDGPGPAPPNLFAVGYFDSAGGLAADHLARWDGARWLPVGDGTNSPGVAALAAHDEDGQGPGAPALFVGGYFDAAGGVVAPHIARYDGAEWSDVGGGVNSFVTALTTFDPGGAGGGAPWLILGGSFTIAGGHPGFARVAAWNGTDWVALGSGVAGGVPPATVQALAVVDPDGPGPSPGVLYAGGEFTVPGNRVVRWTGATWAPLGSGVNDTVYALASFDDDGPGPAPARLFAAGAFTMVNGSPMSHLARWDGATWSDVSGGVEGTAYAMTVFDEDGDGAMARALYVGGTFGQAGGVAALRVARWDGVSWSALGSGIQDDWVLALGGGDVDGSGPEPPALYAGGLTHAGGAPAAHAARWSEGNWSALGSGLELGAGAISAFSTGGPDAIYFGGGFTSAGGQSSSHIAAWGPVPPAITQQPVAQGVGIGAAASFTVAATGVGNLAYQWRHEGTPLTDGGNISGATTSSLTIDPVQPSDGGRYDAVITDDCALATSKAARLLVAEVGDLDLDGQVNVSDLLLLLGAWGTCPAPGACPADLNADGQVGTTDLLLLLSHWG